MTQFRMGNVQVIINDVVTSENKIAMTREQINDEIKMFFDWRIPLCCIRH